MQTPNRPSGRFLTKSLRKRFSSLQIRIACDSIVEHIDAEMNQVSEGESTIFVSDFVAINLDLDKELTRLLISEINGGSNGATIGNPYKWR